MRESLGSVFLYNIIILFIIVTFAFLSGTLAYVKAFKANSRIVNAIEKYEGYNELSINEINSVLNTLGYKKEVPNCSPNRGTGELMDQTGNHYLYCIYHFSPNNSDMQNKDIYGVVTYMYFDFPVVGRVRIPLYAKTEKVYRFGSGS